MIYKIYAGPQMRRAEVVSVSVGGERIYTVRELYFSGVEVYDGCCESPEAAERRLERTAARLRLREIGRSEELTQI